MVAQGKDKTFQRVTSYWSHKTSSMMSPTNKNNSNNSIADDLMRELLMITTISVKSQLRDHEISLEKSMSGALGEEFQAAANLNKTTKSYRTDRKRTKNSNRCKFDEEAYLPFKKYVSKTMYNHLARKTTSALKNNVTFAVSGKNNSVIIRKGLLKRGWIEKFADPEGGSSGLAVKISDPPDTESLVVSQLMNRHKIRFLWCADGMINWNYINHFTIVNRFPCWRDEPSFTSKVGLCRALERQDWTVRPGYSKVLYPKTFEIINYDDLEVFSNHYRISACLCLVRYFLDHDNIIEPHSGQIPLDIVDFSIQRLCEYVAFKEHNDLDIWNISDVSAAEWELFLFNFNDLIHHNGSFKPSSYFALSELIKACRTVLLAVGKYWQDISVEGYRNMWIVKPGYSSRGRGVTVHKTLIDIIRRCKPGKQYVVQKYIEKPFLIHETKFDIRQWFLITSIYPLVIWMYDDFYLRFSSRLFSLDETHEAVHLCNNSIQHKYQNQTRNPALPENNMWKSCQFYNFLRGVGLQKKYQNIVTGMENGFIEATLAAQENMRHRVNSYCLLGADFILSDDLKPYLIEINASPAMGPTTSVTEEMCANALNDLLKVVIDREVDKAASTGKFRVIYKQRASRDLSTKQFEDLHLSSKRLRITKSDGKKDAAQLGAGVVSLASSKEPLFNSWSQRLLRYEDLAAKFKKSPPPSCLSPPLKDFREDLQPGVPGSVSRLPCEYTSIGVDDGSGSNGTAPGAAATATSSPSVTAASGLSAQLDKLALKLQAIEVSPLSDSGSSVYSKPNSAETNRFKLKTSVSRDIFNGSNKESIKTVENETNQEIQVSPCILA